MDSQKPDRASNGIHSEIGLAVKIALALAIVAMTYLGVQQSITHADTPDSLTTRLEPGLNYVGWVSADTPVAEFFAAVPQVEAVFAWSARNEDWLRAAPGVSPEFNTLQWLTPGMGLIVRLGGDRPVEWTRAFSRASALISLRPGLNLVAWTAGRATLLSEIERDLRQSFRAQYDEAGANAPDRLYTPSQPELVDAFGRIEHGGALWVRAEVWGSWSQRSDARLIIRGRVIGPDGEGIEGLYVQATVMARHGWYFPYITDSDGSFLMFALADSELTISFKHRDGCSSYYREGGTTEQLDEASRVDTSGPVGDLEFRVGDGACGRHIRGTLVDATGTPIADQIVSARTSIPGRGGGGYDRTAEDGSFEIFVPDNVEYVLRTNVADGCDAWYDGAGLTREREAAATVSVSGADSAGVEIRVPADICAWEIRGRVLKHDGTPYPAVQVYPVKADHGTLRSLSTLEDGSFALTLPEPGLYRLGVHTHDNCSGYYANGALVTELEDASTIEVTGDAAAEIELRMPERSCAWEIRGRLTRADGTAVADTRVSARAANGDVNYYSQTDEDGSFAFTPRVDGAFTLRAEVDETCLVFRSDDGISLRNTGATQFRRGDPNLTNVDFRLPEGTCEFRVRGRIVRANGEPLGGGGVVLSRDRWSESVDTEADGSFEIRLPAEGEYQMLLRLAPNCWAYYGDGRLTLSRPSEPGIQTGLARATDLTIRVPEGLCSLQIRGRLIGSDGMPLMGHQTVYASSEDGQHRTVIPTEIDGSFAVTVPVAGSYRVWARLIDQCQVVYLEGGVATDLADGTIVVVDDDHVSGIVVRAPETSCAWTIRGRVVRSDGSPYASVPLVAWMVGGQSGTSGRTGLDGSFEFTFAHDSSRVLSITLDDLCFVYHREEAGFSLTKAEATQFSAASEGKLDIEVRIPEGVCEWRIQGRVVDTHGQPIAGVGVRPWSLDGSSNSPGSTPTAADGSFSLTVAVNGSYRLAVRLDQECTVYHGSNGSTTDLEAASVVQVADADVRDLEVRVSERRCGWHILRGVVVDADSTGLEGVHVGARGSDGVSRIDSTNTDGLFEVRVREDDDYVIEVALEGNCTAYFDGVELTALRGDAAPVRVRGADLTNMTLRVPPDLCRWQVQGEVTTADGTPLADVAVRLYGAGGAPGYAHTFTDSSGAFAARVHNSDNYRLEVEIDGCLLYYDGSGVSPWVDEREYIRVAGVDVSGIAVRVPDDLCVLQIHGVVFDEHGDPLNDYPSVWASGSRGILVFRGSASASGAFSIRVPVPGEYVLLVAWDECSFYRSEEGASLYYEDASPVSVDAGDVSGIEIHLPVNAPQVCRSSLGG